MKRIWNTVVLLLAANFVATAGGVGYLAATGHLTRDRVVAARTALFPPPTTRPSAEPATRPVAVELTAADRLGALAAKAAGRSPAERVLSAQQEQDVALVDADSRARQLHDLQVQVELAKQQLDRDRQAVTNDRDRFSADRDRESAASADKGFQDSLALYRTLPAKQVKAIFAGLSDDAVQRYLQAMDAKQATKVMKEFKSPADVDRLERVLERIRLAKAATTQPSPDATAATADGR